jgi:polyisoprenyl-phosphate glycosyltransferase
MPPSCLSAAGAVKCHAVVSIVVPIYNEQENLPELLRRVSAAMDGAGSSANASTAPPEPWELILVDDGSRDASASIVREWHTRDGRIKLVSLSRNFGHQPAVTAGIHHARGDCVVLIDGDLQDPPEIIPQMVARWREGYQVGVGERRSRSDGAGARGIGFKLFYPIFRHLSDLPGGPDAGIFGLMDRSVVDVFDRLPERNRFIPGLRSWLGFRQTSVTYDRNDRAAGKPKQTLTRLVKYAVDGMVSFSYKPLRAVIYLGFFISGITFLLALYYVATFFVYRKGFSGFTTTIVCVLFLGGVQLVSIGILGEYIGRIYEEIKQRPLYVVQDRLGVDALPGPAERRRPSGGGV